MALGLRQPCLIVRSQLPCGNSIESNEDDGRKYQRPKACAAFIRCLGPYRTGQALRRRQKLAEKTLTVRDGLTGLW